MGFRASPSERRLLSFVLVGACAIGALVFAACGGGSDSGDGGGGGGDETAAAPTVYAYPVSGLGLPQYSFEVPAGSRSEYPGEANPQTIVVPKGSGPAFRLWISQTANDDVEGNAFTKDLPADVDECSFGETGTQEADSGTWSLFQFSCSAPLGGSIDGLAAEAVIGDFTESLVIFSNDSADATDVLNQVISTYAVTPP